MPALTVTPQRVSAGLQRATGEFVVRAPWWVSNTKSVNGDRGNLMMRPRAAAHATATHQRRKEDGMSSRDSAPSRGQETQTGTGSIAARLVLMLVIAALSLVALTASASAATIQGTAPASASAATTDSLTGSADAGSLTTQNVCAKPTNPGQVACLSQVLVTKSGHHPVRSHLAAAHSPDRVAVHGSANPLFSSPFGVAPAAAAATPSPEPQAGTPAWMQQLYDTAYLSQTAGGSDTVGIVDAYDDPNVEADLAVYRSTFGLPPCTTANGCFRKVNQNGQQSNYPPADGDWDMEISLDVDSVSALCPNCHILLVEANGNGLNTAEQEAAALGANQITNSWGGPATAADYQWNIPANISIVVSAGDWGYWGAGAGANYYPESLQRVTDAGGTFTASDTATARGFTETAWNDTGSGCDLTQAKPSWQTDKGCTGRSNTDMSANGSPNSGLLVYDSVYYGGYQGWYPVGGTSESSPLIAAYYAITGTQGASTPQWDYQHAASLNDPSSGSDGTCAANIAYICTAQVGYDGPTGVGSISGDVVAGAPGIGGPTATSGYGSTGAPIGTYVQSNSAAGVKLLAGVYPNGLDTTYYWQYGTTTAYGQQTASVDAGSGTAAATVNTTLTGLAQNSTYHHRLVATNADGTTYGYDFTFATSGAPANTTPPAITGTARQGQTLTTSTGAWTPAASTYAYQWQRNTGSGYATIAGASAATYTPGVADLGATLHAVVTATDAYGPATATTAAVGPVASGAPANTNAPTLSPTTNITRVSTLNVYAGQWSPAATAYTYQWQHCDATGANCATIAGQSTTATAYTLTKADEGYEVRVLETATNAYGSTTATTNAVGPVPASPPVNTQLPTLTSTGTVQRSSIILTTQGYFSGVGNTVTTQWQRCNVVGAACANITGQTGASYTAGLADEGSTLRSLVTASNVDGTAITPSAPTAVVASAPPVTSAPPVISGTAVRANLLTATPGTWAGVANTYSYQWERCGAAGSSCQAIAGQTGLSYTLGKADEGSTLAFAVTAANVDATTTSTSKPTAVVLASPPVNTTAVAVTGTAVRASVLTAIAGAWTGAQSTYVDQWERCNASGAVCQPVSGQTGLTYTLTTADEGSTIIYQVTATNADAVVVAASVPTAVIAASPPVNGTAPAVTGTTARANVLTGTTGTWTGVGNAYADQWERCNAAGAACQPISGQTGLTYTLQQADEGSTITYQVTATNPDKTVIVAAKPTAVIAASPPFATQAPFTSGPAVRASTLTASVGVWVGAGNTYAYQWERCYVAGAACQPISGQTGLTYTLQQADEGSTITYQVTATNVDAVVVRASAPTATVLASPPVATARPTVSGTAVRANVLTATQGAWTGAGNTYVYQWERCSAAGASCQAVSGQTGATYTLAQADEGATIIYQVTATNTDAVVVAASAPTAAVAASPPVNGTAPAVSGTAARASVLTATTGTWTGAGNAYAYQWEDCNAAGQSCQAISGQAGLSYTLQKSDEGSTIAFTVTASNADKTVTAVSKPTPVVLASAPVNTSPPVGSGSVMRTMTLTATTGTWTGTGSTYAYQWEDCNAAGQSCQAISGATGATRVLAQSDEGMSIRVIVTATNADGSATATSFPTAVVAADPPGLTRVAVITGTAKQGQVLTATNYSFVLPPGTVVSEQWEDCNAAGQSCQVIGGATAGTYTLSSADVGSTVEVIVSATNVDKAVSTTSLPSAVVAPSATTKTATVASAAVGSAPSTAETALTNSQGKVLAFAQLASAPAVMHASLATADIRRVQTGGVARVVRVRRAAGVRGPLRVWVLSATDKQARPVTMMFRGRSATLRVPANLGARLVVVVKR